MNSWELPDNVGSMSTLIFALKSQWKLQKRRLSEVIVLCVLWVKCIDANRMQNVGSCRPVFSGEMTLRGSDCKGLNK